MRQLPSCPSLAPPEPPPSLHPSQVFWPQGEACPTPKPPCPAWFPWGSPPPRGEPSPRWGLWLGARGGPL